MVSKVFDVYLVLLVWKKGTHLNYLHSLLTHLCAYTQHTLRTYGLTQKGMCVCVQFFLRFVYISLPSFCVVISAVTANTP